MDGKAVYHELHFTGNPGSPDVLYDYFAMLLRLNNAPATHGRRACTRDAARHGAARCGAARQTLHTHARHARYARVRSRIETMLRPFLCLNERERQAIADFETERQIMHGWDQVFASQWGAEYLPCIHHELRLHRILQNWSYSRSEICKDQTVSAEPKELIGLWDCHLCILGLIYGSCQERNGQARPVAG